MSEAPLTSDDLLIRLRKRIEVARAVESNVSLHPDQVEALVECAEALKRNLRGNCHSADCMVQCSPGVDCDCGFSALKKLETL
jgi:hypothetical protein